MKTSQFQKNSKKLLPYTLLVGLILIFVSGIPLRGGDLEVSKALGEGGPASWFSYSLNYGGNFLSGLLNAMAIDVPILHHVLITLCLATAIIALINFSNPSHSYVYFIALLLALGAPAQIFASSFGATVGYGIMLIPAFLMIMYLFTFSDLLVFKGKKKSWKIPFLFISGFVSQQFSESIGIAFLVISLLYLIFLCNKHGFSWHLGAHFFGCVLGFILSMLIPGTTDRISPSFYVLVDQLNLALDQLFISNILVLATMTLSCLLLIQPFRTERSKNCNITLGCLLIPMGGFALLCVMNPAMGAFVSVNRVLAVVKLVLGIVYTIGIYRTLQHYVSKDKVTTRVQGCLCSVWVFIIVYGATDTAMPYYLYIPYLLLVGATMALLIYALHRYSRVEKILRKPLFFVGLLGVLALSFITIANYKYSEVVDTHIKDNLSAGTTQIELPCAPYESRLVPTDYTQMSDYYDFPAYGTVEISYVPLAQWDWITYYEAHNVPVIEEYDEDAPENQDWIGEIEED